MIVGGGSNFVLLKTVLLCSGLATESRPSQTFFSLSTSTWTLNGK